ncbi:hypothetical protein OC846_004370 [Tilletia horrida]|uniref:Uncharacterized protein n=1 Tax=Tilletia horrida TaxID=155126 RepID=A0AAN6GT23_9BASI|nr:hypothetical protein OC845_003689 [Tilletia horrida]KAK0548753.1 hypothetical protein OC846_004370 [Tilletia horrida]KAK0563858.1 hypothetical protein OC861_004598 [Tilletia horrida]
MTRIGTSKRSAPTPKGKSKSTASKSASKTKETRPVEPSKRASTTASSNNNNSSSSSSSAPARRSLRTSKGRDEEARQHLDDSGLHAVLPVPAAPQTASATTAKSTRKSRPAGSVASTTKAFNSLMKN